MISSLLKYYILITYASCGAEIKNVSGTPSMLPIVQYHYARNSLFARRGTQKGGFAFLKRCEKTFFRVHVTSDVYESKR